MTGVQTCALPICNPQATARRGARPARSEEPRAPATQTKRARLPAFSTEQDGAEKLADWRLSKVSLASGRAGQLVPAPLPPQPARPEARTARPPRPHEPRPRQFRFASFGVCHEGCFRLPATRAVIYSGAKTAPAPADAGPPVLASAKYNCVLWPYRLARLSRSLLCWPLRPNASAVRAPDGPRILHTTPLTPLFCSVWRGRCPPTPHARPPIPGGCACT